MSAIDQSVFKKDFTIIKSLGKGASSKVYSVLHIPTKRKYALKVVLSKDQKVVETFQEVETVKCVPHQSIIKIHYYFVRKIQNTSNIEICFVMDLADRSLFQQIKARSTKNQSYSKKQLWKFLEDMVNVLCCLEEVGVLHRDIKPDNILIVGEDDYRLADFGYAILNHFYSVKTIAGSPTYASPKLRPKFQNSKKIVSGNNSKDDVYSLGVTLLDMIFLQHVVFEDRKQSLTEVQQLYDQILQEIVCMMLCQSEHKRPNFKELKAYIQSKRISLSTTIIKKYPNQNHTQQALTKKKNTNQKIKKRNKIKLNKDIYCMLLVKGEIIVGVDSGISVIVDDHEHNLKITKHPVTSIHLDDRKQIIWFGSLDSKIRSIRVIDVLQKVKFFRDKQLDSSFLLQKMIEIEVKLPVSFITTINSEVKLDQPYLIGYYHNSVEIPSISFQRQKIISATITYASYYNKHVYAADSNGVLWKYNHKIFFQNEQKYEAESAIIKFQHMEYEEEQVIIILTLQGYYHVVNTRTMKCQKMIRLTKQNILCCIFGNGGQLIAGTQQGNLIDQNGNVLWQLKVKGICGIEEQDKVIVCCTFDGYIIKLDNL